MIVKPKYYSQRELILYLDGLRNGKLISFAVIKKYCDEATYNKLEQLINIAMIRHIDKYIDDHGEKADAMSEMRDD